MSVHIGDGSLSINAVQRTVKRSRPGGLTMTGFSVLSLFAASEQGVLYDPSDLSTVWQDSVGTVPGVVGQPVGLVLDKSKGLVPGPALVTNGDFSNGTTGWSVGANLTASVVSGQVNIGRTGAIAANNAFRQDVATTAGRSYLITVDVVTNNGAARNFTDSTGASLTGVGSAGFVGTGTFTYIVVATDSAIGLNFWTDLGTTSVYDNISVRELPGNHARQTTTASKPILRQSGALYYLEFDGTDDFLVTSTITPGVDKAQVFAGVRKLSDAAQKVVVELSASTAANNGTFLLAAPDAASATFAFDSKGTVQTDAVATGQASPVTAVLTGLGDIAGDTATIRVNGVQVDQDTGDQGTGNFLAYPMYIGRRGGTSLPFSGHIYGMIVRFGSNLPAGTITQTETYMAAKTGVTI